MEKNNKIIHVEPSVFMAQKFSAEVRAQLDRKVLEQRVLPNGDVNISGFQLTASEVKRINRLTAKGREEQAMRIVTSARRRALETLIHDHRKEMRRGIKAMRQMDNESRDVVDGSGTPPASVGAIS